MIVYYVENNDIFEANCKEGTDYYYCYKATNIRTGQEIYEFWADKNNCHKNIVDCLNTVFDGILKEIDKLDIINTWYMDWTKKYIIENI